MNRTADESPRTDTTPDIDAIIACLSEGKSVREKLASGGHLHIDRPLPFICVYETVGDVRQAAHDVVNSNASYLITPDIAGETALLNALGRAMIDRYGAFLVIVVSEFERDRVLTDDSPYLPPFEVEVRAANGGDAAMAAIADAIENVSVKYRSPVVSKINEWSVEERTALSGIDDSLGILAVRFAPIYRQSDGSGAYPELRERLVANIFDAILRGAAAYAKTRGALDLATHRSLGRRTFIDAVRKLDMQIDKISSAFDFLMAVTPINADAAWDEFKAGGHEKAPTLLYRPMSIEIDAEKRALFSIGFGNLEDPVLYQIYREKQQELDLQLTAIDLRDTPRFKEASSLLYGVVEPSLLQRAKDILDLPKKPVASTKGEGGPEGHVDCFELRDAASQMVAEYRREYDGFAPEIAIRDDLPAGMMVSGHRLMISRSTRMSRQRVPALLNHEIGVHLMTYFAGDAQGLRIFRTGLAGYEGLQEGLAVFAEYLVGGLTQGRLRLLAARVVGCAAMLNGADFTETYRLLSVTYGFSDSAAFNLTVRLFRSGGLAKDAIYLRGLGEILDHMAQGKSLDPYWLGKFASSQFPVIEELISRGLLEPPPIRPSFLNDPGAQRRLAAARAGLTPADLITEQD